MPILLRRVDERLLHGQVVVGWGRRLDPDHYLIVDDLLAASEWEQELYLLTVDGEDVDVTFLSVAEARGDWSAWEARDERVVLLVRDVDTMHRLAAGGRMQGSEINLGGIHHGPGRTQVRPYLHLTPEDRTRIRSLAEEDGTRVTARDLPDATPVPLDELLSG